MKKKQYFQQGSSLGKGSAVGQCQDWHSQWGWGEGSSGTVVGERLAGRAVPELYRKSVCSFACICLLWKGALHQLIYPQPFMEHLLCAWHSWRTTQAKSLSSYSFHYSRRRQAINMITRYRSIIESGSNNL